MSIDVPPELHASLHRRIDCPVTWCSGQWFEHGGNGDAPEEWEHDDADGIELPYGARLYRSQLGSGQVEWSLLLKGDGQMFSLLPASPAGYARELRAIADAIDELDA